MDWWSEYIGIPFGDHTCWSLVQQIYRDRLNIDLPLHGELSAEYVAAVDVLHSGNAPASRMIAARKAVADAIEVGQSSESWVSVTTPMEHDVVLMSVISGRRRIGHVGIAVSAKRMLHIEKATNAVIVPFTHPSVVGRICGYRRHTRVC